MSPAETLATLAPIARRKLADWSLGKRAKAVGALIIEESFAQGRSGVRMFNREIEEMLGMDKGCVSDALAELVAAGVVQAVGRSGSCRLFRFLPNAEFVEPPTRVDSHRATAARQEVRRRNSIGPEVECTGQRPLPIKTAEERLAEDLATGSAERAFEQSEPQDANLMRLSMLASLRGAGWTEEELTGKNGAESGRPQPVNNSVFFAPALGSAPRGEPRPLGTQPSATQRLPLVRPLELGTTVPQWTHCGDGSPKPENGKSREERRQIALVDQDLLRRVAENVGPENRGYWAVILGKGGQRTARALFEALGEFELGNGAPGNANPSRYLFGIYKRCLSAIPTATPAGKV